ncbi:MAG: hypothetical protein ABSF64_08805 [Bryobacteraceae bacterium]
MVHERYEDWDFFPSKGESSYGYSGPLQLGLGGSYSAANHSQNAASVFVKRAFLHLKGERSNVRLGRFEFTAGGEVMPKDATLAIVKRDGISQRLIGTFGFSDVQRNFDGAQ